MTTSEKKIPYRVEFSRILELFASQIYQSPLALLRENVQNAFDAVRMREAIGDPFEPAIHISVDNALIAVQDNGIGMTAAEIETNFWYAGRSSKNTALARAAGVVGTFGIGAMSNFGVADELIVESESSSTGERTISSARKSDLAVDRESISLNGMPTMGIPGTVVTARLASEVKISVDDAREYVRQFVEFVDVPVLFNGEKLSGSAHRSLLPSERHAWLEKRSNVQLGNVLTADLELLGMASGELRLVLQNVRSGANTGKSGTMVLLADRHLIRTMRSGFGLASVGVPSCYQWGGVVDLPFLTPTAGREALDEDSYNVLTKVLMSLDNVVSEIAASHSESFNSEHFLRWIQNTRKFSLCGNLEATVQPSGVQERLAELVGRPGVRYFGGNDSNAVAVHASEETPVIVLARRSPRRACEQGYLQWRGVKEVDTTPSVTKEFLPQELSFPYSAMAARVARTLEDDYFLIADVKFGTNTGNLPLLVQANQSPPVIFLNPHSSSATTLTTLYAEDYGAFGPFVKDFVRSEIFPKVADLVPSRTRQGADELLRRLRSNREWFEYELADKADVEEILEEYRAGRLSIVEVAARMPDTGRSFVEVSSAGTANLSSVVSIEENAHDADPTPDLYEPRPAIDRRETRTDALILTSDTPINGYTCFLSISDRVQKERGDFFLHPHSTEVLWGGRKVIFIFQHHSGDIGLYYDILCPGLVQAATGGGLHVTSTIVARDRTFIPIPEGLTVDFMPTADEKKRLAVKGEIIRLGE